MRLTKLTNPTTLPLALNSLKRQLRIEEDDTGYDDDLTEIIWDAVEYLECECHITLISTQVRATWDCWPADIVKLPAWPISSIDSITYTDTNGASQTLSSSLYRTNLVQCPAVVMPEIGESWPSLEADSINAVNINLTAGYGAAASDVPRMAQRYLKLLCGHWFLNRESVVTGVVGKEIEMATTSLMHQLRVNEFQEFLNQ